MSIDKYPSIDFVRQCVREEDGRLFWLVRPRDHFVDERAWKIWNTRFSLKEAGNLFTTNGIDQRWQLNFYGQKILRYVVVWALHHGRWELGLDHKDRNPLNDRIENLRIATHEQNMRNASKPSTNISGYKGVAWESKRQKWFASIRINGKSKYLGRFDDPLEAHNAYMDAARKYFGEFACQG